MDNIVRLKNNWLTYRSFPPVNINSLVWITAASGYDLSFVTINGTNYMWYIGKSDGELDDIYNQIIELLKQ